MPPPHRPSLRQAELDSRLIRLRDLEHELIAAPETYTTLAARPARALVAGVGFGLLVIVVVAIVSVAGAVRRDQAARSGAAPPAVTSTLPPVRGDR